MTDFFFFFTDTPGSCAGGIATAEPSPTAFAGASSFTSSVVIIALPPFAITDLTNFSASALSL